MRSLGIWRERKRNELLRGDKSSQRHQKGKHCFAKKIKNKWLLLGTRHPGRVHYVRKTKVRKIGSVEADEGWWRHPTRSRISSYVQVSEIQVMRGADKTNIRLKLVTERDWWAECIWQGRFRGELEKLGEIKSEEKEDVLLATAVKWLWQGGETDNGVQRLGDKFPSPKSHSVIGICLVICDHHCHQGTWGPLLNLGRWCAIKSEVEKL